MDDRQLQKHRTAATKLSALMLITFASTGIAGCQSSQQSAPPSASAPSSTSISASPVELPFTGLNAPYGVAVDSHGNVYVTDAGNNRVLKLPAGSKSQVELPFDGLRGGWGIAADGAGDVYVVENSGSNSRVRKLHAGSKNSTPLPFTGLRNPAGVAVDAAGNVYVSNADEFEVLKLAAGSDTEISLPFTGHCHVD